MALDYLIDAVEIDSGLLVKAVFQESAGKQLTGSLNRSVGVEEQQIKVETLTNDIKLSIGIDPLKARKASHRLTRATFTIPVLTAEIQWQHDAYLRVNKTKNPSQALVADVAREMGDMEDAFILTATDVTIGDNEGLFQSGNFTAATAELDLGTYAEGILTLSNMFGQLVSGMKGEVRKNAVVLVITPTVESIMAGVVSTNDGTSLLTGAEVMLKQRGGAGSGILVAERLGCAIDFVDGVLTITNAVESSVGRAALVLVSPKVMTTHASIYDQRIRPYNKVDGYYNKVVERYLNLIHNAEGIIGSVAVVKA